MRGSVLLVLASLGLATVGSMLLWAARRITWRRPTPFLERLGSMSPVPGRPVGPASGISRLDPMTPAAGAEPSEAVASAAVSSTAVPSEAVLSEAVPSEAVPSDSPAGSER